jgi:hypothetical protein
LRPGWWYELLNRSKAAYEFFVRGCDHSSGFPDLADNVKEDHITHLRVHAFTAVEQFIY